MRAGAGAPGLLGTRFFAQGFVVDPGSNARGATVTNAAAAVLGLF